jgi:hypothetical protein
MTTERNSRMYGRRTSSFVSCPCIILRYTVISISEAIFISRPPHLVARSSSFRKIQPSPGHIRPIQRSSSGVTSKIDRIDNFTASCPKQCPNDSHAMSSAHRRAQAADQRTRTSREEAVVVMEMPRRRGVAVERITCSIRPSLDSIF